MQGAEWKAKQRLKAAKAKDRQAQGATLTAAEFKRQNCNQGQQTKARAAVTVRTNIGKGGTHATKKDKDRLRGSWIRVEKNPGDLWKPETPDALRPLSLASLRHNVKSL